MTSLNLAQHCDVYLGTRVSGDGNMNTLSHDKLQGQSFVCYTALNHQFGADLS
jgi:hypothetical protein